MPAACFTATYTSATLVGARRTLRRSVSHHASAGQALRWLGRRLRAGGVPLDQPGQDPALAALADNAAFHQACFELNHGGTPLRAQQRTGRRVITVAVASTAHWPLLPGSPRPGAEPSRAVRRAVLVRSRMLGAGRRRLLRAEARERLETQR
ncbi:hypothetical protein F7Q99_36350 [Streptomyces kaniharaensis]|uniref:Uncharacterized protein n=1 Tax=Streptomyces kaniharaensis TaxID=212423 RepID=A0A6N7L594_9ACTN|nr:hypothetical protein [Streptomyces kaniharaensis]MQS17514.1 hypothetical protein [Streptomyces kaniharaensis]